MTRAVFREHVFKILFRYEFYDITEFNEQVDLYISECMEAENSKEDVFASVKLRVNEIVAHILDIDKKISELCVGWKMERIGKAELSILRVAAYEIMYDDSIEPAVSINEAVLLSKKYCDEKAHSFVNGVLAKLIK